MQCQVASRQCTFHTLRSFKVIISGEGEWYTAKSTFQDVWYTAKSTFQHVWYTAKSTFQDEWNTAKSTFQDVWYTAKSAFQDVWYIQCQVNITGCMIHRRVGLWGVSWKKFENMPKNYIILWDQKKLFDEKQRLKISYLSIKVKIQKIIWKFEKHSFGRTCTVEEIYFPHASAISLDWPLNNVFIKAYAQTHPSLRPFI